MEGKDEKETLNSISHCYAHKKRSALTERLEVSK